MHPSGSAAAFSAFALTAVTSGLTPAEAAAGHHTPGLLPDPATTPVPNPPFPKNLTRTERKQLETFDQLDFDVFTHADWKRLRLSHAKNIRVHWPDGHFSDGIEQHITDLSALFVWGPDTRILSHPLRVAKDNLTCVTGVMQGAFTQPMPDGKGGFIQPNGKKYAVNMATVGLWNRRGVMDEEFLFWDKPVLLPADQPRLRVRS